MMVLRRWMLGLALPVGLTAAWAGKTWLGETPAYGQVGSPAAVTGKLPIKKVVLFSSGVGYFQRDGEVDGDAKIDLTFPVNDINDLLKSLTLNDLGGGRIQAIGYDSHDPVERTLKSFAIDLSGNPSQADILGQARGEKVEIILAAGQNATGSIVGVEKQEVVGKDCGKTIVESLNLLTTDGMRSFRLAEVQRVKFLNPVLDAELRRALETLTLSRDTQKKAVSFKFSGAGKRAVRVGYVVENPIWKTSYRLVLDKDGKPFLQGWAIVENPTDEDWSDVRMALVSGRPISFKMDLYSPLYLNRPLVEPELFASLRPPTYDGAMGGSKPAGQVNDIAPSRVLAGSTGAPGQAPRGAAERLEERMSRAKDAAAARYAALPTEAAAAGDEKKLDLSQGVSAAAAGAQLGDYFQYTLDDPVSVARQKSALIPIVNKEVDGSRVSIYNPKTHAKYALLGLRFKNNSGLSLMQGPVTVFDGTSYAGDARLPNLQAGEDRLVSYAIDLGTEVEADTKVPPTVYSAVKIIKGILHATRKIHEEKTYKAVNRSKIERTLLIEHPYRPEYRLAGEAKPVERSRDQYRFEVKLPAGGNASTTVVEERDLEQTIALTNSNDDQIRFFLRLPAITPKVKEALEQAMDLRGKWGVVQRDLAGVTKQLADISKDQERLRANLKELPPTAAAYKRYLEKFDQQETQIEKLQGDQKRLQDAETQARAKFENFVANLSVE